MQAWIRAIIKRIWVKDRKVIAIEPHNDYKGCFAATRKVLGQRPLVAPRKNLQREVFSLSFILTNMKSNRVGFFKGFNCG